MNGNLRPLCIGFPDPPWIGPLNFRHGLRNGHNEHFEQKGYMACSRERTMKTQS